MTEENKKSILFVGSFKKEGQDGSVGGQMFACQTILESELGRRYNWLLLDSTAETNVARKRTDILFKAIWRLFRFLFFLTKRPKLVLIFSANGLSFYEKGLLCLLAKLFWRNVIFAPRGGALLSEIHHSGFKKWYAKRVFSAADYVICQSNFWKESYSLLLSKQDHKFVVIENWINLEKYPLDLSQKNKKISLIYLSWVTEEKGIFELLEAVEYLKQKETTFDLYICGDGDAMDQVAGIISERKWKHVKLKGWVKGIDKINLLQKVHILVTPSYFEGFSNTLLEAMAMGLAVISTPVGSAIDVIKDFENGILVPKKNARELAHKIEWLIDNPSEINTLGTNARLRVSKFNTIESAVLSVGKLLAKLC